MKHQYIFLLFLSLPFFLVHCTKQAVEDDNEQTVFQPTPYGLLIPQGFPKLNIPIDNPLTLEGISLGRSLFYDPILSGNNTQSCASCHAQAFSFSDHATQLSEGIDGIKGKRNAPAVINVAWMPELFWDGRASSVEDQVLEPVPNPIEMHLKWTDALKKLNQHADYPDAFFRAFGSREIDSMMVVKAIAQFERTLVSSDSKWDKYLRNEVALTQAEAQGFEIFFTEKGDCFHCHTTILFTDQLFHNNGLDSLFADQGRFMHTGNQHDLAKFKTPTLRNIEFTAPYMHDGRFETIEEVVDFYSEGIVWSPTVDPLMKKVNQGGLQLNQQEKACLIAFLKTLSDSAFIQNPAYSNPHEND